MKKNNIHAFFTSIISRDDVINSKPDPEHLMKVLEELGSEPSNTLVIGDHPVDMECANNIGAYSIAVLNKRHGIEEAINCDAESWRVFSVVEAKRIMKRFNIPQNGGIPALKKALQFRVYANINDQEIVEVSEDRFIFSMNDCRVQSARNRKGLPDFPCKEVGLVEYEYFAKTIDPRINVKCLSCPPDPHPDSYYCAWEFTYEK